MDFSKRTDLTAFAKNRYRLIKKPAEDQVGIIRIPHESPED